MCEATIVIIALGAIPIVLDPFRMLPEKRIVHFALERGIRWSVNDGGNRDCVHTQHQTFSRCGTGLKIRFQLLPELKIDMFSTNIGSCQRRRGRNHFRDFFWFDIFMA